MKEEALVAGERVSMMDAWHTHQETCYGDSVPLLPSACYFLSLPLSLLSLLLLHFGI